MSNPQNVIANYKSVNAALKPLSFGCSLVHPPSADATYCSYTNCSILPQDKGHPGTAAPCPTEIVEVGSPALAIPLLGNGIKGKGTAIAEALLEVSSHMLPCMDLAASERQIPNHSGMQSVWKVQTRYSYTIRKQIIGAHLQKATLGRDSPIPPQWFISYNCNYLFETVQRMAFHQMCTQHPVIISTLLEVERARKKKKKKWWLFHSNNKDLAQRENDSH